MAVPKQEKELIIAYREQGRSYKEIAVLTGQTEGYCRTVWSRAKRDKKTFADHQCQYCGRELIMTKGASARANTAL